MHPSSATSTSVYVFSSHETSDTPASAFGAPTLSLAASSLVLSHFFGTADKHPFNVQSAPDGFSAVDEVLSYPAIRRDVFESIGGNLVVILGGVESAEDLFPSREPTFFVSSTPTPTEFSALVRKLSVRNDEISFDDERSGVRLAVGDKRLIDAIPAKPTTVNAFKSLAKRYPETAYDLFDVTISEDAAFVIEVQYVADLISSLSEARQHITYDTPDFIGVRMSGLEGIRRKHGVESKQYRGAVNILKNLFEMYVIPDFAQTYKAIALATFITLPTTSTSSAISKRSFPESLVSCYPNQTVCEFSTSNCSSHGTCAQLPSTENTTTCFACKCAKNGTAYAGIQCELQDVSMDFHLLFWTCVSLLIMTAGVCWFLVQSGDLENGGIALGSAVTLKQD